MNLAHILRAVVVFLITSSLILIIVSFSQGQTIGRRVENNTLISDDLPAIKITVNKDFKYIGRFDFKIRDVATGERLVFVDAAGKKVRRLFIAQFEGFLPNIDDFYRYNFDNAELFGTHKFRQNTYAYSNLQAREENPEGESSLTYDFLLDKGYEVEDQVMMSRFLTVPDEKKKHELILFYLENVSDSNHKLAEFYKDDNSTAIWQEISKALTERSLKSFVIE